jgi:MoxR-like ATPases
MSSSSRDLNKIASLALSFRREVQKQVVGKDDVIDIMLAALIAGGHILLEGPTGTGKTTLAKSFAHAIAGTFKRIQLTPDLLPADIIGTAIYDNVKKEFVARKGPIFANVVMADELNRASPRTQSAFLEAMQERQVTIDVQTYQLPEPFIVIATQVPEDTGGIYPLTRTQLDRFAAKVEISLPSAAEEAIIMERYNSIDESLPSLTLQDIKTISLIFNDISVSSQVKNYILDIIKNARNTSEVKDYPSPRASIWLYRLSKAFALLNGRAYVLPDDVKAVATPVLSHRLGLQIRNQQDNVKETIKSILDETAVPKE